MFFHKLKAASVFALARSLSILGWKMTVRTYRTLIYCLAALLTFLLFLCSSFFFDFLEKNKTLLSTGTGDENLAVAALFLLYISYTGVLACLRELFTSRRLAITCHPHRQLFKAVNIPLTAVYVSHHTPLIILLAINYTALTVGVLRSWWHHLAYSPMLLTTIIATPVLFILLLIYVSSRNANVAPRHTQKNVWIMLPLLVITGVSTYQISHWLHNLFRPSSALYIPEMSASLHSFSRAIPIVSTVVILSLLLFTLLTIRNIQRMRNTTFASERFSVPQPTTLRFAARSNASQWLTTANYRTLSAHPSSVLLARYLSITLLLVAAIMGVILGGLQTSALPLEPITNLTLAAIFIASLSLSATIAKTIGPLALIPKLHFLYEHGKSSLVLARTTLSLEIATNTLIVTPSLLSAHLLLGEHTFLRLLLIPLTIVFANAIAYSITTNPRYQPDGTTGTSEDSLAVALICLLLCAPTIALLYFNTTGHDLAALAWSLILLGGALVCLHRRIRNIPCYL